MEQHVRFKDRVTFVVSWISSNCDSRLYTFRFVSRAVVHLSSSLKTVFSSKIAVHYIDQI